MRDWHGPHTRFSFWTPSFPRFESHSLPRDGLILGTFRLLRIVWFAASLPLHLTLLAISVLAPRRIDTRILCPLSGFHPRWNAQQRLAYPLLRRIIWAIADVGSADALTPNAEFKYPWWAWGLEEFTVRIGGGARVDVETSRVALPKAARDAGWFVGDALDPEDRVRPEPVPCFWFQRRDIRSESAAFTRIASTQKTGRVDKPERIILYFVGGGYVTGSPTEGSRCFKLARETGLPVVGANFRKATSPERAFPAQLQDALAVYSHLVLDLGYRDIALAGDSAGGNLALMLVQYLADLALAHEFKPRKNGDEATSRIVLPTGLLLFSPWCDFTAATYGEALQSRRGTTDDPVHDIICASMATNSMRMYLERVLRAGNAKRARDDRGGGDDDESAPQPESVYALQGSHPYFSPSLPSALSSWQRVARAYSRPFTRTAAAKPLRVLVTTGTTELFNLEIVRLVELLRRVAAAAAGDPSSGGSGGGGGGRRERCGIEVECVSAEGEVHAFPLVPEWISPEAAQAWRVIRSWCAAQ